MQGCQSKFGVRVLHRHAIKQKRKESHKESHQPPWLKAGGGARVALSSGFTQWGSLGRDAYPAIGPWGFQTRVCLFRVQTHALVRAGSLRVSHMPVGLSWWGFLLSPAAVSPGSEVGVGPWSSSAALANQDEHMVSKSFSLF